MKTCEVFSIDGGDDSERLANAKLNLPGHTAAIGVYAENLTQLVERVSKILGAFNE